ncbi:MAG: CpsD/CapB family tyrosine-protein kinase [Thermoguttaceae bacterium]|jgi:Mrp family chromosome partitioning ATPase|nr:CpsD/CapB family tyrosine-protein kinase [Thermoguttaceae bacterium]
MIGQPTIPLPVETDSMLQHLAEESGEYFRTVLRHLQWPAAGGWEGGSATAPFRTLGVTSCSRREGVSMVAAQLSAAAVHLDEGPVLLVDANLTHPAVHELFDVDFSPGLSEALLDPAILPACVQPSGRDHLSLLTAGEPNGHLPKAFDTGGIGSVIETLAQEYKLIVFDMPPAGEQSAALRLAGLLDAVVIVVEAERVCYEVARRTRQLLERAGASVRGAVLNKRRDYVPRWLYRT